MMDDRFGLILHAKNLTFDCQQLVGMVLSCVRKDRTDRYVQYTCWDRSQIPDPNLEQKLNPVFVSCF